MPRPKSADIFHTQIDIFKYAMKNAGMFLAAARQIFMISLVGHSRFEYLLFFINIKKILNIFI